MDESSIKLEKYKNLEKISEFTQYFVVILGLLVVQLPLPFEINKTAAYIIALIIILFSITWHRVLPEKYSGLTKNFIESLQGTFGIFVIVNLTGGINSYFNFFYFLPVLGSAVYMPRKYLLIIATITSFLILATALRSFGVEEFPTILSIAGLQIWGVWLIAAYGRFLSGEISISQKKQEDVKLKEIREIEKLKDEFIFIVSHELRSPITVIRGYLELLTKSPPNKLNKKVNTILLKAFSTSNKLANLVTLFLEIARLETEKFHYHIQDVTIKNSLDRIKYNIGGDLEKKSIELVDNVPRGLQVKFDEERLEEILSVIIDNAMVYTPEFGKVEISAKRVKTGVEIEIEDNGVGISEEKKAKLFEKFYMEKSGVGEYSIKEVNIGMYVVKQLLLRMGGDISVDSKVGKGTTIVIFLPSV